MSKAAVSVEGFISNELKVREAGSHRVVDVSVPHTPQKKEGDQWVDAGETTWFSATFWDEHADAVMDTANKGTLVVLTGFPELEVYKRTDGEPGGKVKIQFPTLSVVVRKPKRGQSIPAQPVQSSGDVWNTPGTFDDSEVPF